MSSKKHKKRNSTHRGGFSLAVLISILLVGIYFWGSVQVDFVVRKTDQLKRQKNTLQQEMNDLKIRINRKKSYQRIVGLAKKQQMIFVSASKLTDLVVELNDADVPAADWRYELDYAGVTLMGLK